MDYFYNSRLVVQVPFQKVNVFCGSRISLYLKRLQLYNRRGCLISFIQSLKREGHKQDHHPMMIVQQLIVSSKKMKATVADLLTLVRVNGCHSNADTSEHLMKTY